MAWPKGVPSVGRMFPTGEAARLRAEGWSLRRIAHHYGVSRQAVRERLRRNEEGGSMNLAGLELGGVAVEKKRGGRPARTAEEVRDEIAALEAEALALGRPPLTLDVIRDRVSGRSHLICDVRRGMVERGEIRGARPARTAAHNERRAAPIDFRLHLKTGCQAKPPGVPSKPERAWRYPLEPVVREHLARERRIRRGNVEKCLDAG